MPEIEDGVTPVAVPVIVALHVGNPEMLPAGMLIENVSVVPDMLPDSVPVKATVSRLVEAVTLPETVVDACDTTHDVRPDPLESTDEPA